MVNKHTVNYHTSLSELTSRIHPLIFLWTPKGFIAPEYFLNFSSNLDIPPWLQKSFKFIVLRLLENMSPKIDSIHFYSCPQTKLSSMFLSSPPRQKEITHFSKQHFLSMYFSQAERQENYGAAKMTKIKHGRLLVTSSLSLPPSLQTLHLRFLFCCAII